ncbi:hypothetical protein [Antarctobacter heliothermus]|uniref:Uncharacterized protein n=1 Tax=Antarctobacter heliothermus TaxID=74033 RepID=A0A239GS35_9RHOB|nr:hypothetical protein [Antarctobacter heliothermus]SNS71313.1 hypothetical protein SAMN04488078_102830 [Antarctobacter heliothermus]
MFTTRKLLVTAFLATILTANGLTPSFAADQPCETDPDWECLELPDQGELEDIYNARESTKASSAVKDVERVQGVTSGPTLLGDGVDIRIRKTEGVRN